MCAKKTLVCKDLTKSYSLLDLHLIQQNLKSVGYASKLSTKLVVIIVKGVLTRRVFVLCVERKYWTLRTINKVVYSCLFVFHFSLFLYSSVSFIDLDLTLPTYN